MQRTKAPMISPLANRYTSVRKFAEITDETPTESRNVLLLLRICSKLVDRMHDEGGLHRCY